MVILMTVYHDQIVGWLTPAANWMKALPAGWTIPIAVLFVISFPPLFGHEVSERALGGARRGERPRLETTGLSSGSSTCEA